MKGKVVLLKEGMQRNGLKITKRELEEVVRNFKQPVPITLGHPRDDRAPAVGFFEKIELKGDTLIGEYSLSPLGDILLSSNNYRNLSAGLRRKPSDGSWFLHHVALLGAMPPGAEDVEPLKVVNLSDSGEVVYFESELEHTQPRKEEVKDMSLEKLQKQVEFLSSTLKKEKLTRLEESAKAKFSDEVVKDLLEFASKLPVEFSDSEKTLIDELIKIVDKLPKPVGEGKKDFSDREGQELNFADSVKAF